MFTYLFWVYWSVAREVIAIIWPRWGRTVQSRQDRNIGMTLPQLCSHLIHSPGPRCLLFWPVRLTSESIVHVNFDLAYSTIEFKMTKSCHTFLNSAYDIFPTLPYYLSSPLFNLKTTIWRNSSYISRLWFCLLESCQVQSITPSSPMSPSRLLPMDDSPQQIEWVPHAGDSVV